MKIDYSSLPSPTLGIWRWKFLPFSRSTAQSSFSLSRFRIFDARKASFLIEIPLDRKTCRLGFLHASDDDNIPRNLLTVVVLAWFRLSPQPQLPRCRHDFFSSFIFGLGIGKVFPFPLPLFFARSHFNPNAWHLLRFPPFE